MKKPHTIPPAAVRKPHGVLNTYVTYRCRCELCRAANAERSARVRDARRERRAR